MIYLAKTSREGRLPRSGEYSQKSSTEKLETLHRHSLSSFAGFLMFYTDSVKISSERSKKALPLSSSSRGHPSLWNRSVFFLLGCLLCSIGAHRTSIKSLLHGEQDVKLKMP